MNAFQFGQLVAEKMAEGPAPLAEAPMPTPVPHYQALADYTASAARKHDFSKAESGLNAQTKYLQSVLRGLDSKFYTHPVTRPAPLLPQAASSKSPPPPRRAPSPAPGPDTRVPPADKNTQPPARTLYGALGSRVPGSFLPPLPPATQPAK